MLEYIVRLSSLSWQYTVKLLIQAGSHIEARSAKEAECPPGASCGRSRPKVYSLDKVKCKCLVVFCIRNEVYHIHTKS